MPIFDRIRSAYLEKKLSIFITETRVIVKGIIYQIFCCIIMSSIDDAHVYPPLPFIMIN